MSTEPRDEVIGIAGLGKMGSAMAQRLAGAGRRVAGWTRRGVDVALAGELGIVAAVSVVELVAQSDIVMLSLFDNDAVDAVLGQIAQSDLTGKLIVEMSTVSPQVLRRHLPGIGAAGGSAMDAPISGGPEMVMAGQAGLYMGGAEADIARFMPVAEVLSNRIVHVGGPGDGAAAKIVNNMMLAGQWEALKEALRVGKRAGLSLETMMGFLLDSPSATTAMRQRAPIILGESDRVGFPVSGVIKDTALFVETANRFGLETPAVSAALASYRAAEEAGHGEDDLAMMVRLGFLDA